MKTISLSSREVMFAHGLASVRSGSFSPSHDHERTAFGKSSYVVHLIGAKSEIAVAKYYNLEVDKSAKETGDKTDFEILYNGIPATLDVKTTTYRPVWLQVRETKMNSSFYLSTYMKNELATEVCLAGWAKDDDLFNGQYMKSPAGGLHFNYKLDESELSPLPTRHEIESGRQNDELPTEVQA